MSEPEDLSRIIKEAEQKQQELARQYDLADEAGRLALAAAEPEFREYLDHRNALESIAAARRSAIQNEGNFYIY
jgi:hypothetical protein